MQAILNKKPYNVSMVILFSEGILTGLKGGRYV